MNWVGAIVIATMLTGCSWNCKPCVNTCPTGSIPSADVLEKIGGLHDAEVDEWMIKIYRLHKKLQLHTTK